MKKCLFFVAFFYGILMVVQPFTADADTPSLILGAKVPFHFNLKKESPYVPVEGGGAGIGAGLYVEAIPFPYVALESGFYVRTFGLGGDVSYQEIHIPVVGKFRFPVSDNHAFTLGGGITYCNPFGGKIHLTLDEDDPMKIPKEDLISDFGFVAKMGLQIRLSQSFLLFDLGIEDVRKPIKIKQTDSFFTFGMGFSLF